MNPTHAATAGLRAVARVRGVREQDSRFGLQHALMDADADRTRLRLLDGRLDEQSDTSPPGRELATVTFLDRRRHVLALGTAIGEAQEKAASSDAVAVAALTRWQHAKTQLEAIELLQERRAQAARDEVRRREARDQDDIASLLWRRRTGGHA
jgi:flagellar protein FliJ